MKDDESRITDLLLVEERDKAIHVRTKDGNKACWLPRSQITISKDPVIPGELHRSISVTMPDWLAEEKGL